MTESRPIMVVTLSVDAEKEGEFGTFYNHRFLPVFLDACPEIVGIRRYEEFTNGAALRWYNKQFITIYELRSEKDIPATDTIFSGKAVADVVAEFQNWKAKHLRNFTRITYKETWSHGRRSPDGAFGSRPFFLWSHEMKEEHDAEFQRWYEQEYLPLQVADIPTWTDCRRYESVGRQPIRRLTVFESQDETTLARSMTDLRAANRISENYAWQKRVEEAVVWQDAATFRCIYRRPN